MNAGISIYLLLIHFGIPNILIGRKHRQTIFFKDLSIAYS